MTCGTTTGQTAGAIGAHGSRPPGGDRVRRRPRVSIEDERTVRSGQGGVTAVEAPLHLPVRRTSRPAPPPLPAFPAAPPEPRLACHVSFRPADVRTLVTPGPLVHLYGRRHIDLRRVAGALCCR